MNCVSKEITFVSIVYDAGVNYNLGMLGNSVTYIINDIITYIPFLFPFYKSQNFIQVNIEQRFIWVDVA